MIINPHTGKKDNVHAIVLGAVVAIVVKFLLEGMKLKIGDISFTMTHTDASSYSAVLIPIIGLMGVREWKQLDKKKKEEG